jgi:hypothetical protein
MTYPGIEPRNVLRHSLDEIPNFKHMFEPQLHGYNWIPIYSCSIVLKPFMQMTRNTELQNYNIAQKTALNHNIHLYSR